MGLDIHHTKTRTKSQNWIYGHEWVNRLEKIKCFRLIFNYVLFQFKAFFLTKMTLTDKEYGHRLDRPNQVFAPKADQSPPPTAVMATVSYRPVCPTEIIHQAYSVP